MTNYFDENAKISDQAIIDISTKNTHTYVGEGSEIDALVRIKHVGGKEDIIIGKNVYLNSGTVLYSGNGITIGDNVLIGPNCSLTPVNHEYRDKNQLIKNQGFMKSKGGIKIEDDVWIGAGVTILDGTFIKKGAIIGANSLVKGVIESYSINVGVPTKCIGYRK